MTRLEKLEAVAEAARKVAYRTGDDWRPVPAHVQKLADTVRALDAHTEAQAQGETVTLAVWRNDGGALQFAAPDTAMDTPVRTWRRLGTVTLPLDREGGR